MFRAPQLLTCALGAALIACTAGCTIVVPAPASPPPPSHVYTAKVTSVGGAVHWRSELNGAYANDGVVTPTTGSPVLLNLTVERGQSAAFLVEIVNSGYAQCSVTRDDGAPILSTVSQDISLPATGRTDPAACRFVGS